MKYRIIYQHYFIRLKFKYAVKHFREWMKAINIFPYKEDTNDKNQVSL